MRGLSKQGEMVRRIYFQVLWRSISFYCGSCPWWQQVFRKYIAIDCAQIWCRHLDCRICLSLSLCVCEDYVTSYFVRFGREMERKRDSVVGREGHDAAHKAHRLQLCSTLEFGLSLSFFHPFYIRLSLPSQSSLLNAITAKTELIRELLHMISRDS